MTCGDVDILFSGPPDVDSNDQNPFSCIVRIWIPGLDCF